MKQKNVPVLTIITPVLVQNEQAAIRLTKRFNLFAEYLSLHPSNIEWFVMVENSHEKFDPISIGLADEVIKVIHTRTNRAWSQSRLKNLALHKASAKKVLILDQDAITPPATLAEIIMLNIHPETCGLFKDKHGSSTMSAMVFYKGLFFDETFVGSRGEREHFIKYHNLQVFTHHQPIGLLYDNYHRYHHTNYETNETLDKKQDTIKVSNFDEFFKTKTNV